MKDFIIKSIAEKGVLFLFLAVALYAVWQKSTNQDKILQDRIEKLEKQNVACSDKLQQIIISEWQKSNMIIQKNNVLLSAVNTHYKSYTE